MKLNCVKYNVYTINECTAWLSRLQYSDGGIAIQIGRNFSLPTNQAVKKAMLDKIYNPLDK